MIITSWRIGTTYGGAYRWFWVRVHSDVEEMRAACHRARPWHGRANWRDAAAVCHTAAAAYADADTEFKHPRWPANGYAGTIRLVAGDMTSEIVAHELVHAAAHVYRMNCQPVVNLGDGFDDSYHQSEEDFAYIYGILFREMDHVLSNIAEKVPID